MIDQRKPAEVREDVAMIATLEALVRAARKRQASDLHLEPGLPAAMRVRGDLASAGEPLPPEALRDAARALLGADGWAAFVERGSADLSRTLAGVRCRINVLRTGRGVGLAVRLLASFQPTLAQLNLHPSLRELVRHRHGLVLVSGPTGSGKSSTLAALVQELNLAEARHIITLEQPVEYAFRPRCAFIRQREVGRDTPTFAQGILDALREDFDVLVVGEMRDPETMRLTLSAAETGHLVLATLHSATAAEALQRMAGAFGPDAQPAIAAQLSDCLRAAVAQRLAFRPEPGLRVPELEVLVATTPVRSLIRQGAFFKLTSALETGAQDGQWTFARYRQWLDGRADWRRFDARGEPPDGEPDADLPPPALPPLNAPDASPRPRRAASPSASAAQAPPSTDGAGGDGVIVIKPPEGSLEDILSELEDE